MAEILDIEFYNDFIKQIGLGINISKLYPRGHPSLIPVVQRLKLLLKELPLEKESLSVVVIEDVLMIDEQRFESKKLPIVKSLVDRFSQVGVKSITFDVDTSEDDLSGFFLAMAATPAEISDYGDIAALLRAKGILKIKINKYRVGVVSSDEEIKEINWEKFLESIISYKEFTEEDKIKQLGNFLAGVGVVGSEPPDIQTNKVIAGLEKIALTIADQYGEERWNEYSIVFSRILAVLSPVIKKNIIRYRTENKKLAALFKSLIPTMPDEDIIDIIATKAKEKGPNSEDEIVDILRGITGTRLPNILSTIRVNLPELNFERIVSRLMAELKTVDGTEAADKFMSKNLEVEMRSFFPKLREKSIQERTKAVEDLLDFSKKLFAAKNYELLRILIERYDSMSDAEEDLSVFKKVIEAMKVISQRAQELGVEDLVQFISKKFSRHLIRREKIFIDKKKIVISAIGELKDQNYLAELVSLLWDPGTFAEAREALISMADFSLPVLLESLKETEDRSVRMKIIDVIIKIGERSIPGVVKLLSASDWFIRRNALYILGELKAHQAIDEIGKLLEDKNEEVQLEAISALSKIGVEKAKEYIKNGLNSHFPRVVISAMRNLDREEVKPKLLEVTQWLKRKKGVPDEKEENFRIEVINLLGEVGDDSVVDALSEILNEKALFKGDLLLATKEAVLHSLARIGSEKARSTLQEATRHREQFVSATARSILERI
uniref:HEAT repeat domain-containing protein n=1 Tax=candidate division WOR-3 bacterium TaxID=2052148 RepID=A0A7C4TGF0_UNCW3